MIGGQLRPLAARALACAVRRRVLSSAVAPGTAEEEQPKRPRSNRMVAAAFDQLKPNLEEQISAANGSVESLLAVAAEPGVQREHALKIVAALAERSAAEGSATSKFEDDPRFVRLCQMLGQQAAKDLNTKNDLATVLSVTADDEAARMAHSLSVEQTVKVMSTLASKRRRPTALLRALSANLIKSQDTLSLKQSSDLLFAVALLNFPDESLLDKIQSGLIENIASNEHAAPVCSALTSLGILRYRDSALLDALSEWVICHNAQCRPQDLTSFLMTLAHTGYQPPNMDQVVATVLKRLSGPHDAPSPLVWLDTVWALTVLGHLQPALASSVLEPNFKRQMLDSELFGPPAIMKLLNVDSAARLEVPKYQGPSLDMDSLQFTPKIPKSKQQMVISVLDALKNLFPSQGFLKTNVDSSMGFLIDAECQVDAKGNPLPLDKPPPARTKSTRIGVFVWEYNDLCRRVREPTGPNKLAMRLLQAQGMRVMQVPHFEFSPNEKLVQRVQYLEKKVKALAKEKKK